MVNLRKNPPLTPRFPLGLSSPPLPSLPFSHPPFFPHLPFPSLFYTLSLLLSYKSRYGSATPGIKVVEA